jgi:ketosteroid isomerase-like protein
MTNRMTVVPVLGAVTLVLVMLGCTSVRTTNLEAAYPQESVLIEQRLKQIFDAAENKEFDRLDTYHFYGPKFTKFSASLPGRQDAAMARKGEHDGIGAINDLKMEAEGLKIDVFGDTAIATFTLKFGFRAGAERIERKEHGTLVFVKDHGDWKITHEHFSPIKSNP